MKLNKPLCLSVLLTAASVFTARAEIHSNLCLYGCPSGSPVTNDLIIRNIYLLSSNDETNLADWVAYKVTPTSIGSGKPRKWKPDPLLDDSETLEPADYKGAHAELGTDRGHQVPLASFAGTEEWYSTNYLSNITPQKSALNQGPWKNLEEAERDMARQEKAVYVMSGPIFGDSDISLPGADEPTELPEAYWKIVSVETKTGLRTATFLMPQAAGRKDDFCSFIAPLATISETTGLTFFHAANYAEEAHQHIASPVECRSWLK